MKLISLVTSQAYNGNARFQTRQRQFGLFSDDNGVRRYGGRLTKVDLPFTTKHPHDAGSAAAP